MISAERAENSGFFTKKWNVPSSYFIEKNQAVYQSKLIEILQTLSPKEMRDLQAFVSCSAFNTNEEVTNLLNVTADAHPKFNDEFIEREILYRRIFPRTKFDMQKLRYVATDLMRQVENFLTIKELDKTDFVKKELLLSALADRNLDKLFESCIQSLRKSLTEKRESDNKLLLENYLLEERAYMFANTRKKRFMTVLDMKWFYVKILRK